MAISIYFFFIIPQLLNPARLSHLIINKRMIVFNNLLKQLFHFLKAFNLIGRLIFYFAAVTVKKAGVYP